jgi:hypothetical protein
MCVPRRYCIVSRKRLPLAEGCIFRLFLARRTPIANAPLTCLNCHSSNTRRSRRRTALDYIFGFSGVLPWRCDACEARFYARVVPWRNFLYAHCGFCGNLALQRISAEYVPGMTAMIGRVLRLPALRCEPCRHKFFSVRPLWREEQEAAATPAK